MVKNFFETDTDDEFPDKRELFVQLALELISEKEYDSRKHLIFDIQARFKGMDLDPYSIAQAYKILKEEKIELIDENGTGKKLLKCTGKAKLTNIIAYQGYFRRIYFTVDPAYGKLITKIINSHYEKRFLNAIALDNMVICFYKPKKQKNSDDDSTAKYHPTRSELKDEILEIIEKHLKY